MTPYENPAKEQIAMLSNIEELLRLNPDERDKINNTIFGISNKLNIHPHDLSIYLLIRTERL